jgi:acetolactate synthase I/II/III large subunit
MSRPYLVGDLVADFLERCGVTSAFGIISVHNIPILDAISNRNAIRFVMARGEMGAGHMADAYARVSGGLSALVTSTGPGAASAVAGLVEARFAGSPVLHITGQTATKFADRGMGTVHDVADQLGMMRSVCKAAYRIRTAEEALGVLTKATTEALTAPRGPVSVEIPIDIQRTPVQPPADFGDFALSLPERLSPSPTDLRHLSDAVMAARRPMLWLGSGARDAGGAAGRLLDLGFRAVTSWAGRGVIPEDDARSLGALNGLGMPDIQKFYETVDLMIVAGSRLRGHETFDFTVKLPANLVQIDVNPLANGRTYPVRQFVLGDSKLTLEALLLEVDGRMKVDPTFADDFSRLRERARSDFRASLGPYASFPEQIRAAMPRGATWVRDITIANSSWGNRMMPVFHPSENVYPVGAGIGLGLPLGVGAAVAGAGQRKTVVLTGDGGFALNMTELWTAVQEKLDLVIVVMNDNGYGVIRQIQDAQYGGRHVYGDLKVPDLEGVAKLAGIPFWRVSSADRLEQMIKWAIDAAGPSLVEVDVASIGAIPPYFPYDQNPKQAA